LNESKNKKLLIYKIREVPHRNIYLSITQNYKMKKVKNGQSNQPLFLEKKHLKLHSKIGSIQINVSGRLDSNCKR
jgi:hypothetical protein